MIGDENPEICNSNNIDLIKIDVEGHEPNVIIGLQKTIAKHSPILVIEWNCDETRNGFTQHDIFTTLLNDYQAYELTTPENIFRNWRRKHKDIYPIKSLTRWICRLFISKKTRRKPTLVRGFNKDKDYLNIVLIPKDKYNYMLKSMMHC